MVRPAPDPGARNVWPTAWRILALGLGVYFVGFIAYAVISQRGLVSDGAGYFIDIVTRGRVFDPEPSRWFSNLLTQWPVLAARGLQVADLTLLSRLYSFGLFYLGLAVLPVSWLLLPRESKALIAWPALTLVLGWMGSCYSAISQGQVMALWFWPTAFALAYTDIRSVLRAGILLLLVLPTVLMHEAMCFLGPILAAVAFRRGAGESGQAARWFWRIIGLWLVGGAGLGLYFTLHPFNPRDRSGFVYGIVHLHFLYGGHGKFNPPVAVALAADALMLGCCLWERGFRRLRPLWLPAYGLVLVLAGLSPLLLPRLFAPQLQADARSWVVAVPLFLAAAYAATGSGLLRIPPTARPLLLTIGAMAAASQITWQIAATMQWNGFLAEMRQQLAAGRGYVPYETAMRGRDAAGAPARDILVTTWTFPQLSIALAPGGRVATIIGNPEPIWWQAFDPKQPAALPAIAGVDYKAYLDALTATSP